jgi:hypothetical protein
MHQIFKNSMIAGFIGLSMLPACKQASDKAEKAVQTRVPVTISTIRKGDMVTYIELSATSEFLLKSAIKAPVSGYIESMHTSPGETVNKGRVLFTLQTKEAAALKDDTLSKLTFRGVVNVTTSGDGLILSIEHQKGDYVNEGDQLCQVAVPGSLVFVLDVPFELVSCVKVNMPCDITLPDNGLIKGIVKSRLPLMSGSSQTERFIVRLEDTNNLPENLSGKIRIVKESFKDAASLSKSCILTDETMESFWVMKLVSDTVAVKVNVSTGITEGDFVQIINPVFSDNDFFLSSGNYGLEDTAFVSVLKNPEP